MDENLCERFIKLVANVALAITELRALRWNSYASGVDVADDLTLTQTMEERKVNWTDANISLLVDLVTDDERWAIIRGKFSPTLTIQSNKKSLDEDNGKVIKQLCMQ